MSTVVTKMINPSFTLNNLIRSTFISSRFYSKNRSKRLIKCLFGSSFSNSTTLKYNIKSTCIRACHYKAAVLKSFGDELEIKKLDRQKIKENEIRIKVHKCAVNVADTLICSGKYDYVPELPFTPGFEFSGEVLEIGSSVKNYYEGDKVIGLNKSTYSAMATECISQQQNLFKIPQGVSLESAAALVDSYATVLIAARRANLKEKDKVLVTVGAGGLGLAAVDIAANLFNADVIGACDTEGKTELLRKKGAFCTVNYSKKEVVKKVMKETNNEGVKLVFDAVGGDVFEDCLQSIALEGSVIVLGFSSRKIPQILTSQLLPKSCALIGVSLTHYQKMVNETYKNSVKEVIDMYLEEFIEPHVAETFKLEDVNKAMEHVEKRKCAGKVLIDLS